jgi:hypothetical protein
MDNSTMEFSKSIRFFLSYIPPVEFNQLLIPNFSRVLSVTQIRHLEILKEQLFIDVLMGITESLPQVTTIKVHSLSLEQLRDSKTGKLDVFPPIEWINHVTKVYLEKVSAIEEIYSLMNLYPYMSYLKIDSVDNMKMDAFIQHILEKVNLESNQHLRLLCLRAPAIDDSMVYTAKKVKNDYTINWIDGFMFLHWK